MHGRVQGVYFRAFVQSVASALGLTGYVRNMEGGEVEFEAEGEQNRLDKLVERVRMGPPRARVESIDLEWSEDTGSYSDFTIRY